MNSVIADSTLDDLLDHARSSRWRGALVSVTHRGRVRNATCGDEVALELEIVGGHVQNLRFQGRGCFLSLAAASLLCERMCGAHVDDLRNQTASELLGFDPGQLSSHRQRCCRLVVEAWQQVLRQVE